LKGRTACLSDCRVVCQSFASLTLGANEGFTYRITASSEMHATGC